ncbi:MAG TPA: D-alanyl-D-alanine carboxypeptidase/D-alanyl-D-alanine-endopeptidase [Nocardioides sp.]|nr:D-alanyl-D-alanine carboxypeptidase/D-alanyl-D-alanine-endopeptidase [Nocardioides sp.]
MPQGDGHHPERSGRVLRRVSSGVVVGVLVLALVAHVFELGPRWFGFDYPSPVDEPAEVAPPPGLTLPEAAEPEPVADAAEEVAVDARAVRAALRRLVRAPALGSRVAVRVTQLPDGATVYSHGVDRVTPASTLKLLTAAAALHELGPEHRFSTSVVAAPALTRVVLVGGGDPLLASRPRGQEVYPVRADVDTLARATARTLRDAGRTRVRVGFDDTLFTGPGVSPDWEPSYVPDNVVTPVSSLWVDEGVPAGDWRRSRQPALEAAQAFARSLERRGIEVAGQPRRQVAPEGAGEVARVESAPLAQVAEQVLAVSDNEGAEVLARHVALARGADPSFAGATQAVRDALAEVGVDTSGDRILDGSGLARGNRLAPETLTSLITVAAGAEEGDLRPVLTGLPVAGFSGSLTYRFDEGDPAGEGAVRAKTGTLSRVSGLAGTVTTVDGAVLGFVVVADRIRKPRTEEARELVDRLAAELAACTCAS